MKEMNLWEFLKQLEEVTEDLTIKELKEIEVRTTLTDTDSNITEGNINKVTGIWDVSGEGTKIILNLGGNLAYRELDKTESSKGEPLEKILKVQDYHRLFSLIENSFFEELFTIKGGKLEESVSKARCLTQQVLNNDIENFNKSTNNKFADILNRMLKEL